MATNIPPHNLDEVCAAVVHLLRNPGATVDDLMEFVRGLTSQRAVRSSVVSGSNPRIARGVVR